MSLPSGKNWTLFVQRLAHLGHRRLVLVEGEPEWGRAWVAARLEAFDAAEVLWVGNTDDAGRAGVRGVASKECRRWLGQEIGVLVWDGWQGNPPDGFAALAGTLKAGGVLFWLMPPLDSWPEFMDADYARTGLDQALEHPFAARLARVLAADAEVIRIRPGAEALPALPEVGPEAEPFAPTTTDEQSQLVTRLVRFGLGRRRRPLVVTADRGRGKSAALGMAAAELLLAGREQVLVTAPSAENLQSFFRHAADRLGDQLATRSGAAWATTAESRNRQMMDGIFIG